MAKIVAGATYTDSELLDLANEAYAKVLAGGRDVMFNGRRVTRDDLGSIAEAITRLEGRIAAANGGTGSKHTQARLVRP